MNQVWLTELRFLANTVLLFVAFGAGICQAASITISGHVMDIQRVEFIDHFVCFHNYSFKIY